MNHVPYSSSYFISFTLLGHMMLLFLLIMVSSVRVIYSDVSNNFSATYSDTCDYEYKYPCGDVCIHKKNILGLPNICMCGDVPLTNGDYLDHLTMKYCCSLLHCKILYSLKPQSLQYYF